jgi:hypothetical protein
MALPGDYKKLKNKWLNKTHSVGSPDLDALITLIGSNNQSDDIISGNIKVISRDLTLTAGDSIGFKITGSSGSYIKSIRADNFNIKYVSQMTGTSVVDSSAKSLNLSDEGTYNAYYAEFSPVSYNINDVIISTDDCLELGLYSNDSVYAIITNNTDNSINGSFIICVQEIEGSASFIGLTPTTDLQPMTEMSNYG